MERGSDKHGFRIDDDLAKDAEPIERSGKTAHVEPERIDEEVVTEEEIEGEGPPIV